MYWLILVVIVLLVLAAIAIKLKQPAEKTEGYPHIFSNLILLRHILLFSISRSEPEALKSGA
jgi:hypothetical protein